MACWPSMGPTGRATRTVTVGTATLLALSLVGVSPTGAMETATPATAAGPISSVDLAAAGSFSNVYQQWKNGPDPSGSNAYLPIGVWEQSGNRQENGQDNALNYRALGINVDVNGYEPADGWPTWQLGASGPYGLDPPYSEPPGLNQSSFLADEPDMNQVDFPTNNELTAPALQAEANAVRTWDPTRPTYVNFGKCMSISDWIGCNTGIQSPAATSYQTMMRQYCSAADIESSDYYGYTDPYEPANYHGAYTYGLAIVNDKAMCGLAKPTLGFVETGHPFPNSGTTTPAQIRAAVWDEVLHGANGIIYFVHDFYSDGFTEDGLLTTEADAKPTVQSVDSELTQLAPELNSPSLTGVSASSSGGVPVTTMLKVFGGQTYLFAMADGNASLPNSGATTATFKVPGTGDATLATVLGENRTVTVTGGTLTDQFSPYQVHIYELNPLLDLLPGGGTDIGVGADGAVWVVGTNPVGGGFGIYRWNGSGWSREPGGAVAVAVGSDGTPWVVNSAHRIYRWNGAGWVVYPGGATDIGVGADGAVWVVGTNPIGGGFGIYRWEGTTWVEQPGGAVAIAVGSDGDAWAVTSSHQIFSG
jgi:hypothetical protein